MLSSDTAFIHSDMGGLVIMPFVGGDFLNNLAMIHLHPIFSPLYPLLSERTWPT